MDVYIVGAGLRFYKFPEQFHGRCVAQHMLQSFLPCIHTFPAQIGCGCRWAGYRHVWAAICAATAFRHLRQSTFFAGHWWSWSITITRIIIDWFVLAYRSRVAHTRTIRTIPLLLALDSIDPPQTDIFNFPNLLINLFDNNHLCLGQ